MRRDARAIRVLPITILLALGLVGRGPAGQRPSVPEAKGPPKTTVGNAAATRLEVQGEIPRPLALSREEFARLPRRTVRAKGHDGVESDYQGVPLVDVLARAGVPTGAELRGKALTSYVVVEAADGYRAMFSLPELDAAFTDRTILLADRRDGRPLSEREAPLQVIVPGEKKHARWVRRVVRLVVGRA